MVVKMHGACRTGYIGEGYEVLKQLFNLFIIRRGGALITDVKGLMAVNQWQVRSSLQMNIVVLYM